MMLVVVLIGVAAALVANPRDVPVATGQTIAHARAALLKQGWHPVRPNKPWWPNDYPEVEACSQGPEFCLFNYTRSGRCLKVETKGERIRRVISWAHVCPSN